MLKPRLRDSFLLTLIASAFLAASAPGAQACGFSGKSPYRGGLACEITYSAPNTNFAVKGRATYFTNCRDCLEPALKYAGGLESPLQMAARKKCSSPRVNEEWRTRHSFKIKQTSPSGPLKYVTFDKCS